MNEIIELMLRRGDGTVTAMSYVKKDVRREYDASPEAIAAHIRKHFPDTIEWRVVEPGDRFTVAFSYADPYFGAWSYDSKAITHDMAKARDIYRERTRWNRSALLAALDVDYQRADEDEDEPAKRAIAERKQRLRDATADPRIEACATVEELTALDVLADISGPTTVGVMETDKDASRRTG